MYRSIHKYSTVILATSILAACGGGDQGYHGATNSSGQTKFKTKSHY